MGESFGCAKPGGVVKAIVSRDPAASAVGASAAHHVAVLVVKPERPVLLPCVLPMLWARAMTSES
jgi:hypothetical protein